MCVPVSSKDLARFYAEWLDIAETYDYPEPVPEQAPWFSGRNGLCSNIRDWLYYTPDANAGVIMEMSDQLDALHGRADAYPFGFEAYRAAKLNNSMHKDPNRLAWVRARLADYNAQYNKEHVNDDDAGSAPAL